MIRSRNQKKFIVFNLIRFIILPVALYQPVRGANGGGGSSVITVTRLKQLDIKQEREDFLFSLACRSEQKPTWTSFEWVLQLKRPGRETE